jgi:type I restriction enzyme S subunit
MSKFTKHKLEEIADVQTGPFGSQLHRSDYKKEGTPIITVEHLGENRIIHKNLPLVGDEDKNRLKKYILKEGDIVFSRVGSVDRCAYVSANEDDWMFSGRLLRVRTNDKVDSRFLSFYFNQESFKEHIRMIAVGATMPSINTTILSEVEIVLPPLKEQKVIAEILSSLDDKIDLLHRQNKTLENFVETLFRQWFVEDADESWDEFRLEEFVETTNGFNHNISDLKEFGDYLLSMGSIINSYGIDLSATRFIKNDNIPSKYLCNVGDIIITTRDITQDAEILGSPAIIPSYLSSNKIYVGSNLYKLTLNNSSIKSNLIYWLLRSQPYREYVKSVATGTSILMLRKVDLMNFSFRLPKKEKLNIYSDQLINLQEKLDSNFSQIRTLSQMRNKILPKLINGEAALKN